MQRAQVTVNVGSAGLFHRFQQSLLLVGLTMSLEGRQERGYLTGVFRPAGQQPVNLLWPLQQENLHGDSAVLTGVAQGLLPQLQFEQAFVERDRKSVVSGK